MTDKAQNETKGGSAVDLQRRVRATETSNLFMLLQENLAKKDRPLIDETRLKTGQDWSVLGPQVVGAEN